MAITTGVLDNFNRSNATTLGASWAGKVNSADADLGITSNKAASKGSDWDHARSCWGTSCGAAQEAYVTVSTNSGDDHGIELFFRCTNIGTTTPDGYLLVAYRYSSGIYFELETITDGDTATIYECDTTGFNDGHKFGITAIGTQLTIYVDKGSGWTQVGQVTDSTYTDGGYIGIGTDSLTTRFDDFGGGTAIQTIAASGLTAALTAGSPTVTPGAVNIAAIGLEAALTFGSPVIAAEAGGQTITVSGMELTVTIGSPTLTVGTVDIAASGLELTATIGQPAVTPGAVGIQATGLELTAALGSPTITPGAVDIAANGLELTAIIGSPVISSGVVITASGLELTATLGSPAITTGAVNIDAVGLELTGGIGSPTITGGLVIVPATDDAGEVSLRYRDMEFLLPIRDSIFSLPGRDNVFLIPGRDMELALSMRVMAVHLEDR